MSVHDASRTSGLTQSSASPRPVAERVESDAPTGPSSSRRRFLQGAAVAASLAAMPASARAARLRGRTATTAPAVGADAAAAALVFEGTIVGVTTEHVDVQVQNEAHRLTLTSQSSLWRGGNVGSSVLAVGDSLLVHVSPTSALVRGWANLGKIRGEITGRTAKGYVVTAPGYSGKSGQTAELIVAASARMTNAHSGVLLAQPQELSIGSQVDGAGLVADGAVIASTLSATQSGSTPVTPPAMPPDGVVALPNAFCRHFYRGIATNFSCGIGAGACGNCGGGAASSSCAWPNLSGHGNFSAGCKNQVAIPCGATVTVTDHCSQSTINLIARDAGPCDNAGLCGANDVCSHSSTICVTWTSPVVDLTLAAFSRFRDPSQFGSFPCTAATIIQQAEC